MSRTPKRTVWLDHDSKANHRITARPTPAKPGLWRAPDGTYMLGARPVAECARAMAARGLIQYRQPRPA